MTPEEAFQFCHICEDTQPVRRQANRRGLPLWRCGRCGLIFQHPQPTAAQLVRLYDRSYYEAWDLFHSEEVVRAQKLAHFSCLIRDWIGNGGGLRVLDVGCGTGFFLEAAQTAGHEAFGVELSPYASRLAIERFGAHRVHAGTLHSAPFPDSTFDVVVMCDLLEHVRRPRAILEAVAALLAPGGLCICVTPMVGGTSFELMGPRWTHYKLEHLFYFSPRNLSALLKSEGFEVRYTGSVKKTVTLHYVASQFQVYRDSLLTPLLRFGECMLPAAVRKARFRLPLGDMLCVARWPQGGQTKPQAGSI